MHGVERGGGEHARDGGVRGQARARAQAQARARAQAQAQAQAQARARARAQAQAQAQAQAHAHAHAQAGGGARSWSFERSPVLGGLKSLASLDPAARGFGVDPACAPGWWGWVHEQRRDDKCCEFIPCVWRWCVKCVPMQSRSGASIAIWLSSCGGLVRLCRFTSRRRLAYVLVVVV